MNVIIFRSQTNLFFFKISVTPAEILAGTNIDFGAPNAGTGKSWLINKAGGKIISGATAYNVAPTFNIISENANEPQFTDGGRINLFTAGANYELIQRTILNTQNAFTEDGKIYLEINNIPTSGDLELEFFITAQKINFIP